MHHLLLVLLVTLFSIGTAVAESDTEALRVLTEPLIVVQDKSHQACGITFIASKHSEPPVKQPLRLELTVLLAPTDGQPGVFGFVKSRLHRETAKGQLGVDTKERPIKLAGVDIHSEGGERAQALKRGGEDNGRSAIASYDAEPVLRTLLGLANGGKPMLATVRIAGERKPQVFRFTECVPQDHAKKVEECLSALLAEAQQRLEPKR